MKKKFNLLVLILIIGMIMLSIQACTGVIAGGITLEGAITIFQAWADGQAVPGTSAGVYVGELQEGDIIGSEDPGAPPEISQARASAPLNGDGWLFYLDEAPGAFYSHPGKILAIGKNGQTLYSEDTTGYPTVNGDRPVIFASPASTIYAVDRAVWNPSNILIPVGIIQWPGVIFRLARYGAVVVNGLTPTQNLYTEASNAHDMMVDAMEDLMNDGGTYDHVRSVDYPGNSPTAFANAVADLITNKSINNITLYFIAHGNTQYMNIGGTGYYASTLKTLINSYPNVNFSILIESCHAGSWRAYFQDPSNTPANLDIIITSTSAAKSAYPDWDNSSGLTDINAAADQWVEWTSDFILQMEYYTNPANWGTVTGLTSPVLPNDKVRLYYLSYLRVKSGTPTVTSLVLTERNPIAIQEPEMYYQ